MSPSVGVGAEYGAYKNPANGQTTKVRGVDTEASVSVGVADDAHPASTERDRDAEIEFSEKGLPEGSASAPVSGYLYFPLSTKKKNTPLQLKYSLNGETVILSLP